MKAYDKLLFLDIDGVLNSVQYHIRVKGYGIYGIDPECIARVQNIVDQTDCGIVISSTWRRIHKLPEIRDLFVKSGLRTPENIIGYTPVMSVNSSHRRGEEIVAYLKSYPFNGLLLRYACLDDDSDFLPTQKLVRTSNEIGLTDADMEEVISYLNH